MIDLTYSHSYKNVYDSLNIFSSPLDNSVISEKFKQSECNNKELGHRRTQLLGKSDYVCLPE